MTLLSVVQDVCAVVGVVRPTSVFTNLTNNRTMQEMLSLANEMAKRIAYDTRDWTMFKAICTMNGTGLDVSYSSYPLPADYKRMLVTSQVRRSTNVRHPMRFIPDLDEWLVRRARSIYDPWGEWTIVGGNMLIAPPLPAGVYCYYPYLQKNCISLASGGIGDAFMADGDAFLLDERTFRLGMVWQWKANKGSQYTEDMQTYGDALANIQGHDSPSPTLVGRMGITYAAKTAYPFPVPTPPTVPT